MPEASRIYLPKLNRQCLIPALVVVLQFCRHKTLIIKELDSRENHTLVFQIHFLYQYSLQFFLDIYHNVLYENPNLKGITDHTQRLSIITKDLFQVQFFN